MAKKKRAGHEENPERWLVSYADFMTLMFAFFAVLYATSQVDTKKTQEFQQSIQKYLIRYGAFGDSGERVNQGVRFNSPIEQPLRTFPQASKNTTEALRQVEIYVEEELNEKELEEKVKDISAGVRGVRISVAASTIFPEGSSRFRKESLETIDKIAKFLKDTKYRVAVETHVDESSKGSEAYPTSWDLTASRASKMIRYMVKVHKFAPDRLVAVSFGGYSPVVPSDSQKNRRRNQRLDFILLTEESSF